VLHGDQAPESPRLLAAGFYCVVPSIPSPTGLWHCLFAAASYLACVDVAGWFIAQSQ
jgi:hypothetical protein